MKIYNLATDKSGKGRLSYRFCPEKRPWDVSPWPLPPLRETSSSKMILWSWSGSLCPRQMGLGQNILQESLLRTAIKDEHNQHLLHIFRVLFSRSFCLILGWRKSIISILTETSSNKLPPPPPPPRCTSIMSSMWMCPKFGYLFQRKILSLRKRWPFH